MDCTFTGDRIDSADLGDWNVNKTLTGGISATIQLESKDGKYTIDNIDLRGVQVTLKAIVNTIEYTLFEGRVRGVSETYEISGREFIDLQLASIPSLLFRKPITAETLNGTGETILRYLLDDYGGLDSCWIDSINDNATFFTYVNFAENSLIAGMRKLCEACRVEMFSTSEGKLKVEPKKDFTDVTDFTFTSDDIFNISRSTTELEVPSVCRVRGRYVAETEAGTETYISQDTYSATADASDYLIMRLKSEVKLSNAMALQGDVNITSGATNGEVIGLREDDIYIRFDGTFTVGSQHDIQFEVIGPSYRVEEFVDEVVKSIGEGLNESLYNKTAGDKVFPFTSYEKSSPDTQIMLHYDEPNSSRVELVVANSQFLDQFGVTYMAVDNLYIQDSADAQLIGERALFEKSIARARVNISGPFNPNIMDLNNVVEFPSMYRQGDIQKGLLTGLSYSYKQDPRSFQVSYEIAAEVPDITYS